MVYVDFMIDIHCHLEQSDYDKDRQDVINKCRNTLDAIITCCANPKHLKITLDICKENKGFVFCALSAHPEYIKDIDDIDNYIKLIDNLAKERSEIVAIGETGLDYFWIKEEEWREKQKQMFIKFINLAKDLDLPLVIHSRDAVEDAIKILEKENAKNVVMHMFGANQLTKKVVENGWYISMNAILLKSKKHKKVVRNCPLEKLMLETDSPWLSPDGGRNDPTSVKIVAEKIAEIKKISVEEVDRVTTENAKRFFRINYK